MSHPRWLVSEDCVYCAVSRHSYFACVRLGGFADSDRQAASFYLQMLGKDVIGRSNIIANKALRRKPDHKPMLDERKRRILNCLEDTL